ncbi:hypothetical protein J5N97_011103 [Dioscorea zingiberensis]|uniref:non-specific serine/threonine protein kinase n=1 Tax=Dioscorea zingiberensis TaxID=325984 RepID=A0A9D5HNA0_9LILI|nr:hypothetical protein J5N97_011103 [Dioscorea zingiberensis]
MKLSFLALLALITLWTISIPQSSSLTPDGEALLELKSGFNDTKGLLRSWKHKDHNPCGWLGVTCHFPDLRVRSMALHRNSLHGPIPPEIKNCTELRAIYLRANYLQGSIPPEIGELDYLTILDLSSNLLRGTIPPSIGQLVNLRFLNLSTNFFSGEIPNVGVLSSFRNTSFVGNLELCGLPIQKLCRGSLGFPAVLPHSENVASQGAKLVTFHGDLPYSSEEIIKKLEQLDEEDIVGSGGFGTVYKMVMDDSSAFAVKRIDRNREGSDQIFETELEILGSIKHINLVNLRGYCKLPSAKLLIYDYLALGSLDHYLHEHGQDDQPLNWNARMKIALGSARGLAYLHHDCSPVIIHRDIKSSNILLDISLEPHVSDFGLAKLLVGDDANVTTVVAGTFGYLAPEYLNDGRATEKSDVYSFGVLLLELVTGKRPTDPCFVRRGLNVVGWLNTLNGGDRLEEVIDEKCGNVGISKLLKRFLI